jgi:molybdopterin converting factor small subunit
VSRIEVTVRCYGTVRERVGERSITLSVPEESTVADALAVLKGRGGDLDTDDLIVVCDGAHLAASDRETRELVAGTTLSISEPIARE